MTRKFDENMEEFFQIEPSEDIQPEIIESTLNFSDYDSDFNDDYIKSRQELDSLIEKGKSALDDILSIAKETEKSRDFEVAATLLNNLVLASEKRMDLHKKIRNITNYKSDQPQQNSTINNTLFVGSTADLTQMLREIKEKEIIPIGND